MAELTVPLNDRAAGPYTATAGQTTFSFDFPVSAVGHLRVTRRRAGVETTLALSADYTVTLAGQAGGYVVLTAATLAGDVIAIYGDKPAERITNFQPPPNSPSSTDFNAQLNDLQMQVQELRTLITRAPKLRDTDAGDDLRLPLKSDRAGKVLSFDGAGLISAQDLTQGPQGPQGTQGTQGIQGIQGIQGLTGAPGLDPKASVAAATTASITLSGLQTIDGVVLLAGNRVLVKDQSLPAQNGIYVAASGAWVRTSDMDEWAEVPHALVAVLGGTTQANTTWVCTSVLAGVIDVTAVSWSRLPVIVQATYRSAWAGAFGQQLIDNDSTPSAKAANTAALQAVIDHAVAERLQVVRISAGRFWFNPPIYVDAPGNLRSSLTTPTIFNFSLDLKGAGGLGNRENHGTMLRFSDNTGMAVIGGTGQGMRYRDFSIHGPGGATSRAALPVNGIGLALCGGSGGATRIEVENMMVEGFRRGCVTGANADQLCDSVTYKKVFIANCFEAWLIKQSQNYIVALIECGGENNTRHVVSPLGKPVTVLGGNFSGTNSHHAAFAIGSTSLLTAFADTYFNTGFTNWTFTTTLAADDQAMIDGAYDAFVIKTPSFGLVPLQLTNYNAGLKVATFRFYPGWYLTHFWKHGGFLDINLKLDTSLEAELQAATQLFASEVTTLFSGSGILAIGIHCENPGVTTCAIDNTTSMRGGRVAELDRAFLNYNPNQAIYATSLLDAEKAIHYAQLVFPFVRCSTDTLRIKDCRVDGDITKSRGLNIEVVGSGQLFFSENTDWDNPNVHLVASAFGNDGAIAAFNATRGAGDWDSSPFFPSGGPRDYARSALLSTPFRGWSPAPSQRPRLTPTRLANIEALGALGSYPLLCGETIYDVLDEASPAETATLSLRSAHRGWSYAQPLTLNWSCKGQSHVLNVSDTSRLFAGLVLVLNVDGAGDHTYLITGVYPTLGYVTVRGLSTNLLAGVKTTTYTGISVGQKVYAIKRTGNLPATKSVTNTTAGATTAAVGNLTGAQFVNLTLSAVGLANYTTRTAAEMFADIPGAHTGLSWIVTISNTNAGTTQLAAGIGVTLVGSMGVPLNTSRMFEFRFTSPTALTVTSLGALSSI